MNTCPNPRCSNSQIPPIAKFCPDCGQPLCAIMPSNISMQEQAEQGDAQAQCDWATNLFFGHTVAKNRKTAAQWFLQAAERGHAQAQYKLVYCYYHGIGIAQNHAEALRWLREAASQGLIAAQYALNLLNKTTN